MNELALNAHMKKHFEKLCSIFKNQKLSVNRRHLKIPTRTNTGGKAYKCLEFGNVFSQSGSLALHKRTHKCKNPHECMDCGNSFSRNNSLTDHKRTHTGEKPYECLECGKIFLKDRLYCIINELIQVKSLTNVWNVEKLFPKLYVNRP